MIWEKKTGGEINAVAVTGVVRFDMNFVRCKDAR